MKKVKKKIEKKVLIPNILTMMRVVLSPIIIFLCVIKKYEVALALVIIACITDFFDGKLARKWNTVTETGAKLDALSDKIFGGCLTICLITKFKFFIPVLIFEALIGFFNLFVYLKTNLRNTLVIGKIKTAFLYATISLGFFGFFKNVNSLLLGFVFMTVNIQILTLISYVIYYYDKIKNEEIEESINNDKTSNSRTKIFDIEEEEKKNKIEKKEYDSDTKVLNHIKDIFIDNDKDEE